MLTRIVAIAAAIVLAAQLIVPITNAAPSHQELTCSQGASPFAATGLSSMVVGNRTDQHIRVANCSSLDPTLTLRIEIESSGTALVQIREDHFKGEVTSCGATCVMWLVSLDQLEYQDLFVHFDPQTAGQVDIQVRGWARYQDDLSFNPPSYTWTLSVIHP